MSYPPTEVKPADRAKRMQQGFSTGLNMGRTGEELAAFQLAGLDRNSGRYREDVPYWQGFAQGYAQGQQQRRPAP